MIWSHPNSPINNISNYDHVILETPLCRCIIEWKSWKENDLYTIMINDVYIFVKK